MSVGPGTKGTRAISTRYPPTSGTTAETTKQAGRQKNLIPTEGTKVLERDRVGIR